jgi:uncharacterized protein (TIGR00251 family)
VTPNASQSTVEPFSFTNPELKVRISAPPADGEANKRARELISKLLGIPKSDVTIIKGATARSKVLLISDFHAIADIQARLAKLADVN